MRHVTFRPSGDELRNRNDVIHKPTAAVLDLPRPEDRNASGRNMVGQVLRLSGSASKNTAFGNSVGMQRSTLIPIFAALRFITGICAWLAPNTTGRLIGLNSGDDQPFTAQLFGSRELTLAVAITDTASPRLQARALQLGLLTDLMDVVAAVRGVRARTLSFTGAIVAGGGAALFAVLGVAALNGQERSA